VHRGVIAGTIRTMSKLRLRSAEAPFDHRRVAGEAARLLCRAEASGIWDPPALVTRLDGQIFGQALDDIAECGVATTRRLEWSTYAEKGSDDFADLSDPNSKTARCHSASSQSLLTPWGQTCAIAWVSPRQHCRDTRVRVEIRPTTWPGGAMCSLRSWGTWPVRTTSAVFEAGSSARGPSSKAGRRPTSCRGSGIRTPPTLRR
jgi:hypothetical protein